MYIKVDVIPLLCDALIKRKGYTDQGEPVVHLDREKLKKMLMANYFELTYVQLHGERFSKCDPGQWVVAYKIDGNGEILISLYSPEIKTYHRWFYILNPDMDGYSDAETLIRVA